MDIDRAVREYEIFDQISVKNARQNRNFIWSSLEGEVAVSENLRFYFDKLNELREVGFN